MKNTFLVTGYTQYPLKEIVAVVEEKTKGDALIHVRKLFTYCKIESVLYYKRQCKTTREEIEYLAKLFPNARLNGDISVQFMEGEDDIYE